MLAILSDASGLGVVVVVLFCGVFVVTVVGGERLSELLLDRATIESYKITTPSSLQTLPKTRLYIHAHVLLPIVLDEDRLHDEFPTVGR